MLVDQRQPELVHLDWSLHALNGGHRAIVLTHLLKGLRKAPEGRDRDFV